MNNQTKNRLKYSSLIALLFFVSCKQKGTAIQEKRVPPSVSVTNPVYGNIQEKEQINGQIVYLNKTTLSAPISGYVKSVKTTVGGKVKKDDLLFEIQTKESAILQQIGQTDLQLGIIKVYATVSGIVSSLSINEAGNYVSEGEAMATIVKNTDLLVQVNAPYEYSQQIINQKTIIIEWANKQVFSALFYKSIPTVDPVSQTQQLLFKLNSHHILPENLNVLITFLKAQSSHALLLPKAAILTNETQDKFWIMKVVSDTLALKIPIETGLENNDSIEIIKPQLQLTDKIIEKGAYGLPDSTCVKLN